MNEKVVNFPSHRIIREHADVDIIAKAKQKSTLKFADSITEEMTSNMIEDLENSGVDVETKQFVKDFSMVVDCCLLPLPNCQCRPPQAALYVAPSPCPWPQGGPQVAIQHPGLCPCQCPGHHQPGPAADCQRRRGSLRRD